MYRILSKKVLFAAFAWLVIGLLWVANAAENLVNQEVKVTAIPAVAWILLNAILWNPVWRFLWKTFPALNDWVFPDLNGTWDVELCSNWPRQEQLLYAAASTENAIDMRHCGESELAKLTPITLRAEVTQTWWSFEMVMYNPAGDTPIDRSNTISVDPIRKRGLLPPGICYFYKQTNATDNVSDDAEFYGAARLSYDPKTDQLKGLTWTARMWRRAMNTAGTITFNRISD